MRLSIKICGMADAGNVAGVVALSPDYMGFIFHRPSLRNAFSLEPEVVGKLPPEVTPVGVFVNRTVEEVAETSARYGIRTVQLHGSEPPEQCLELKRRGFRVWKAIGIDGMVDSDALAAYTGAVDCFVFDTKSPQHGGTGVKYDWELLGSYDLDIPFMLSGGITPDDAACVLGFSHPMLAGVDLNSRFEDAPGVKNIAKLQDFINELR